MNLNLEEKLRQQSKRWRNRLETLLLPKPRNNGFLINWKRYRIPMGTRLVLTFLNSLKNQRLKKKKKKKKRRRRRRRTVSRLPDPVLSISLHMDMILFLSGLGGFNYWSGGWGWVVGWIFLNHLDLVQPASMYIVISCEFISRINFFLLTPWFIHVNSFYFCWSPTMVYRIWGSLQIFLIQWEMILWDFYVWVCLSCVKRSFTIYTWGFDS